MAVLLAFFAVAQAAIIPAPYLVRTPQHDSAIIKSDRLGGNFAWSTVEGHAYAAVSPVVQHVATPVAVTHTYAQPAPIMTYSAPAPLRYAAAPLPYAATPYTFGHHGVVVA